VTDLPADGGVVRVRVINRNDFTIHDRHDGIPYKFAPMNFIDIPETVANHIFGYPGDREDMHRYMAKRWGWNKQEDIALNPKTRRPRWEEWCENIEITLERFELKRVRGPDDPIPADEDTDPDVPDDLKQEELDAAASTLGKSRRFGRLPAMPSAKPASNP